MQDKIDAFTYIKGKEFTKTLREAIGVSSDIELGKVMNLAKSTISTWNAHDRNSFELVIRTHLRTGIPVRELILPKNFPLSELHESFAGNSAVNYQVIPSAQSSEGEGHKPQHQTVTLKSYCLTNGQLVDTGEVPYASRRISGFGLDSADLIEIENNDGVFLVDKNTKQALSGKYLIDIDGMLSINRIQRLPGKLAIAFEDSTIEVSDGDIEVVGKVVLDIRKG